MEVLIVEDNQEKSSQIKETIESMDIRNINIEITTSITECIAKLCTTSVDILILDEQLPVTNGGLISETGGNDIIKTLKTDRYIKKPKKIIYVSAYQDSLTKILNEMPHAAILYQEDSTEWKEKLMEIITFFVQANNQKRRTYLYDVALIATTDTEYEIIKKLSDQWSLIKYTGDTAIYQETQWIRNGRIYKIVATKLNQMGMPAAATVTSKMIYEFVPRYVVMYGIAGGVENDAKFGDIIVATKVWDYCSGKYDTPESIGREPTIEEELAGAINAFKPTSNSMNAKIQITNMQSKNYDAVLNEIYRSYIPTKMPAPPKVWWGSLACGSSVIKNRAIVDVMVRKVDRKTLGIDMESYGVFYAVENAIEPVPKALCVKAISDFADKDKIDDYQAYAAEVSGKFAKELVMDLLDDTIDN